MTAEECGDLRARMISTFRGTQYTTYWKPSYEDLQDIDAGKSIVIEIHLNEWIYAAVHTSLIEYPSLSAYQHAIIYVPGAKELFDIKSGTGIYITFLTTTFPVMSVYIK
jgi:hypothetical protein